MVPTLTITISSSVGGKSDMKDDSDGKKVVEASAAEDIAWMLRARDGDLAAFSLLVEKHQQAIMNFFARSGVYRDVEDLAQEAFLKLYRARRRYKPTAKFTTFLYLIARQVMIDGIRYSSRKAKLYERYGQEAKQWEAAPTMRGECEDAEAALGVLPEPEQAFRPELASEALSPTEWLLAAQEADGTWDPARWGGSGAYPYAVTGFAMMALASGETHDADVARAVWALRAGQSQEGRLGGANDRSMLNHAIATVALLTLYETGRFPESFSVADGAVNYIRTMQDARGGWAGGDAADMWLVDALGRASVLGWPDRGAHLRRGLRQLEATGAWFSAAIARVSTVSGKRCEVARACETWIAANRKIRGGGQVYAQSVARH